MDIDYLLDGSGFGTTFLLDIQNIGNIILSGKALKFKMDYYVWIIIYNGLQMDLLRKNMDSRTKTNFCRFTLILFY